MTGEDQPVRHRPVSADQGGDPACWAHLICDGCGRVLEPGEEHDCPEADDGVSAPG